MVRTIAAEYRADRQLNSACVVDNVIHVII
jgi:hypothetical protein